MAILLKAMGKLGLPGAQIFLSPLEQCPSQIQHEVGVNGESFTEAISEFSA